MLEAMRAARFAILVLGRRHDAAGVIATDLFRRTDVWLVDIGLEASLEEGAMMATRLYTPEQFSMTAGVNVPFDLALIEDLYDALPRRLGETKHTDLIDDRRFAETIYRVALADGIMDRVTYQDPPEDASQSRRLMDERRAHVGRPQATRKIVSHGTGEPLLKLERE